MTTPLIKKSIDTDYVKAHVLKEKMIHLGDK